MTQQTARNDPTSTAAVLLDTAEKLFAEKGIETVSTRQIVLASGQGNLSAALYHFGSREVLIRKLIERRMEVVDMIRHQRLDALRDKAQHPMPRDIIASAAGTLAQVVADYPWGRDYVRVIAQGLTNAHMRLLERLDPEKMSGIARTTELLRRSLPDQPRAVFEARVSIAYHESVYSFARWINANGPITPENRSDFNAMVENLIDFLAGGLCAPVSDHEGTNTDEKPA